MGSGTQEIPVLIPADAIARRRRALAAEITRRHRGDELVMVCILKGSMPFFVDLSRDVGLSVRYDYVGVSSYGDGTSSSGCLSLEADLSEDIAGRRVLLVEDIVDSGRTVAFLRDELGRRGPRSLEVAALLDKPARRTVDVEIDYTGFVVPDRFVVGYGLDHAQRWRNLPYIGVLPGAVAGAGASPGSGASEREG